MNKENNPLEPSLGESVTSQLSQNNGHPKRSKKLTINVFVIGFIIVSIAVLELLKLRKPETVAPIQKTEFQLVQARPVTTGNLQETLAITGTLKANLNVDVSTKAMGRVARVLVREGNRVNRGQLLVTLEDSELRSQVQAARATLQTAQVRLRQQQLALPAQMADVDASIQEAEANLGSAQAKHRQIQLQEPARVTGFYSEVEMAHQAVKTAQVRLSQARRTASQTEQQVEAGIRRTTSAVESAKSALRDTQRGFRIQEIAQAQSDVAVLDAQLTNAEVELNRVQALFDVGAIAQSLLDTARTQRDVLKAQRDKAEQNLSLVREGNTSEAIRQAQETVLQAEAQQNDAEAARGSISVGKGEVAAAVASLAQAKETLRKAQANLADIPAQRQETRIAAETVRQARATLAKAVANRSDIPVAREEVEAARAGVLVAQASLEQAQKALADARIVSPIDGVVNTKNTAPGQAVGAGETLFNIVATNSVYFEAQVDENELDQIQVGLPVHVLVASMAGRPMNGRVTDVIAIANSQSRLFRVRIAISNPPSSLRPGAFARGLLVKRQLIDTLLVPKDALRQKNGKNTIMVVVSTKNATKVTERNVRVGWSASGRTQIIGGVENGELVVVGSPSLREGAKVRITSDSDGIATF